MATNLGPGMNRPLYRSSQSATFQSGQSNTGLWYDKFCNVWDGNWTIRDGQKLEWIKSVTGQSVGCPDRLPSFAKRQAELADKLGGKALTLITATRFATGLGREHPIEIGFAWHHTLGTPCLPGSSIKGLLRAYVREWISRDVANELFGPDDVKDEKRSVGKWVFFDAIPNQPVKLEADVMTPHYGPYYRGEATPGDWHNPVPIPFLAVARDQSFQFAFAPRHASDTGRLTDGTVISNDTIANWLKAALYWLGAGAKTNSGFGVFREAGQLPSETFPKTRMKFSATLELVTPAFLAGADQQDPIDCDLRPATLRGQLRYWWRTLHAGFLEVDTLRALEAAVWGDTKGAGAVRIVVRRTKDSESLPVPGKHIELSKKTNKEVLRPNPTFATQHGLNPAPMKRTPGFLYLSFGMDEMPSGRPSERKHRRCRLPSTEWELVVLARDGWYSRPNASRDEKPRRVAVSLIQQQVIAALSLLCQFGGIGSKSRNGYGCLQLKTPQALALAGIESAASELRQTLNLPNTPFGPSELCVLNDRVVLEPIKTPWKNYWFVLDQLGFSVQDFCQSAGQKRTWVKEALGLPRKIGMSENDGVESKGFERNFDGQTKQDVVWLGQQHPHLGKRVPKDMRHARPIHFHISRNDDGTYSIRAIAFPNRILPDEQTSRRELTAFLDYLKSDLTSRIAMSGPSKANTSVAVVKRPFGTPVKVRIVGVRDKGGFTVKEDGRPEGVLNLGPVPTLPPSVSDVVEVQIKDDTKPPQYQWPKPATAASTKSSNGKKK